MPDASPTNAPAPPTTPDPPNSSARFIAFLVVAIDLLGFGIVLPLLPRYTKGLLPSDTPPLLVGTVIGVLYSAFSAMQFLCAPFWGRYDGQPCPEPIDEADEGGDWNEFNPNKG